VARPGGGGSNEDESEKLERERSVRIEHC
jgi:hypothetical protein